MTTQTNENPVTLKQACRLLGGIAPATFIHYVTEGRNGRKLRAFQNGGPGGRWYTYPSWVREFQVVPDSSGEPYQPSPQAGADMQFLNQVLAEG